MPIAELLQGTGAIATLASGILFILLVTLVKSRSSSWNLFFFWMAFQGLYQSLTQLTIGVIMPGNDVGRALTYLNVGIGGKMTLFVLAVITMAFSGIRLTRVYSLHSNKSIDKYRCIFAYEMIMVTMLSIILIIPFRLPRNIIEVVMIPFFVNFVGLGLLILGAVFIKSGRFECQKPGILGPTIALVITFIFFQFVLRQRITF